MCLVKDTTRHDTTWHKKTQKIFWKKIFFFQKFLFLIIPFLTVIELIMSFLYIPLMPNLNFQNKFFKVFKKIIYNIFVSFHVVSCRVMSYGIVSYWLDSLAWSDNASIYFFVSDSTTLHCNTVKEFRDARASVWTLYIATYVESEHRKNYLYYVIFLLLQ